MKGELIRSCIHNTEPAVDYEYKLPELYCVSSTVKPLEQFKITTDISFEPWNQFPLIIGIVIRQESDLLMNRILKLINIFS